MSSPPPASAPGADLSRLSCLADYEALARQRLPAPVWAYLNAGAADGHTHRANAQALAHTQLLPRVLRRAAGGSAALTLLGRHCPSPILIAPMAYHALAHPDGERATALAAAALGLPLIVSTQASVALEDIARAAPAPLWFQLYPQPDRAISADLLRRAQQAGCQAIVITVDAPIQGLRNEDQRLGFALPAHVRAANLQPYAEQLAQHPASATLAVGQPLFGHPLITHMADWDELAWLIAQTPLPVFVKGLMHPLDVPPALAAGAAGIIVSNHGGRALDGSAAALHALPAIVAAVAQRVPVLVDGAIRRGTDVLKALALGATAVLVGRPVLHGLAVAGATGAAHVLNLLRTELEAAMVLTGCPTLADIGPHCLHPAGHAP
ncbi:MAG: alpha-hydroxy acid oxidase [Pseudomonadota bacterium]|nr:alpha-hydroxy acid oxidase [Pseudomonadota bacterium]